MAAIWEKSYNKLYKQTKGNVKKRDLKKENDDQKDAVGSEEDTGLFEGATVAENGDDQDEGADRN